MMHRLQGMVGRGGRHQSRFRDQQKRGRRNCRRTGLHRRMAAISDIFSG